MVAAKPLAVSLLLLLLSVVTANNSDKEENSSFVRTQSLYPPYIDVDLSNRWFDFGGSTVVNTNRYVRLTPDLFGRKGWLWARMPFAADNFRIEFEYKIHGRGISLFGDGFAFWFTQTKGTVGPVLGSNDKWNGLGIIFDTYDNGNHGYTYPYVNGVLNDGTKTYNKDTDGKELSIGGCEADIRDRPFTTRARIKYFKGKYISLELNTKGWDEWVECFKVPNVKLPDTGYIGFSAETGGLSDNHDIITISTHTLNADGASSESSDPTKQKSSMSSDSYFGSLDTSSGPSYLLVFFAISGIGAVAYFGFQYVTRTERNKRF